jgi:hypothetical protein
MERDQYPPSHENTSGAGQERTVPEAVGRTMNDDQSPLITLISCMVCAKTMKLETIAPDGEGDDLIKYRCEQCGRIERLRLARRSWP